MSSSVSTSLELSPFFLMGVLSAAPLAWGTGKSNLTEPHREEMTGALNNIFQCRKSDHLTLPELQSVVRLFSNILPLLIREEALSFPGVLGSSLFANQREVPSDGESPIQ